MNWKLLGRIFNPSWTLPAAIVGGAFLTLWLGWNWLSEAYDFALPIGIFQWIANMMERAIYAGIAEVKRFDPKVASQVASRAIVTATMFPATGIFDPGFWLIVSPILLWAGPLLDRWLARRRAGATPPSPAAIQ